MGSLAILSRDEALQAGIDWPDIYYSPRYASAVQASDGAPWYVAIWNDGQILMPFLQRPISIGDNGEVESSEYSDIVSPYGYSGCCGPDGAPHDWRGFRAALRRELRGRGVVSEFLRLSSLVPGRDALLKADELLDATRHNDTIGIDTTVTEQIYWDRCEGRARTAVRKATRLGYTAENRAVVAEDLCPGSAFRRMYEATMQRVGARPYYFFDEPYYRALSTELLDHLRWFIARSPSGDASVMALTMVWAPFVHLHLVGSDPAAMRDGAGNLCYDAMLRWSCQQPDIQMCHLGGGLSADDPLFRFKKSFGGERLPYWIASSVFDAQGYRELSQRRAAAIGCSLPQLQACHYFPAYRASGALVQESVERAA